MPPRVSLSGMCGVDDFLTIQSENEASAAVARRAGFTYEGTLRSYGVRQGRRLDVDVFAALPTTWIERWRL
jgi:RimJ/RimL family protein N-acetyltransferase